MLAHKRVCLRRQVRCLLGCGEEMPFEERDEHQVSVFFCAVFLVVVRETSIRLAVVV